MDGLTPYLCFYGRCEQALAFYQGCFAGEITTLMRFAEAPAMPGLEAVDKQRVMHAEFVAPSFTLMASDGMPSATPAPQQTISLSLGFSDDAEQTRVFEALSADGQVVAPLQEMFWQARFGQVIDAYGIQWMLNCPRPE